MHPYAPRLIRCLDLIEVADFRLKRYWIDLQGEPGPALAGWEPALALAKAALPSDVDAAGCARVGFQILHRGRGADYLVLGWWDRENELPLRVFVRYPRTDDALWRAARGGESVCVWDLEVIGFERDAYVRSYLAGLSREAAQQIWTKLRLQRS